MSTPDPREGWTSASSAPYDILCPGRHLAQNGLADRTTEFAEFGTKIHEALAKNDPSLLNTEQQDIFESIQKIEAKVVAEFFRGEEPEVIEREKRFWFRSGELKHSGQVDVLYRKRGRCLILEYKTLPGQVAASPLNEQTRDQVSLVKANTFIVDEIGAAIIQPLVTHNPKTCVYTLDDIIESTKRMVVRIMNSNDPKASRIAGDSQCTYCKAKLSCRAYNEWAGSKLPIAPELIKIPPSLWSPDQRRIFCENKSAAKKWLENCEANIKELLKADNQAVPGWRLSDGDTREVIINPQELFVRFQQSGVTLEAFMKCISITKGKLKDELKATTKLKGESLSKAFDVLCDGLVEQKKNEPSLERIQ